MNAPATSRSRRVTAGAVAVALAGVLITVTVFLNVREQALRSYRVELENDVQQRTTLIVNGVRGSVTLATALRQFVLSAQPVDRARFTTFTRELLNEHREIRRLAWIPRVRFEDRARFEEAVRREGYPGFSIVEHDASRQRHLPAGARQEYFPVHFLEPLEGHVEELGVDLGIDAAIRPVLELGRDSGGPAATGITDVAGPDAVGLAVLVPVYSDGLNPADLDRRRATLIGYCQALIRPSDLLWAVIGDSEPIGLPFDLVDLSAPPEARLLARWVGRLKSEPAWLDRFLPSGQRITVNVPFGGRQWQLAMWPSRPYLQRHYPLAYWLVLPAGLLLAAAFGVYVRNLLSQGERLERAVFDRTRELRESEQALSAEKERLSVTLRSIADAVIAVDMDGAVTSLNKVAEDLTGWRVEEAIGRRLPEVFAVVQRDTREPAGDPVAKVLASGEIVSLADSTTLVSRDGREFFVAERCAPIRDRESRIIGAVLVFRDVTGESKREDELRKTQRLESLAILAGGIAHDFNNILTGVIGNVSLALSDTSPADPTRASLVAAEGAAMRAKSLTQQLLTFSKGGAPLKKDVNLAAVVRDAALFAVHGSSSTCRFIGAESAWRSHVDEGQIAQVIQNMVINSVQAMPDGGVVTISMESAEMREGNPLLLSPGPYVKIRIADTGVGIPPKLIQRVFDPYFSTKQSGSGLGLAICHSVVTRHDGRIEVSSRVGEGTAFDLYLPARLEPPSEAAPLAGPVPKGTGRVLVLDDESLVSGLAARMLESIGYEAQTAEDGAEAVAKFSAAREAGHPFDIVIVDLTIPGGMGGVEATSRMRAIDPALRAIVSSGYSTDPIMANYREHGFASVLTKPYRLEDLKNAIARVDPRRGG